MSPSVLCICCTTYPSRGAMLCEALHAYDLQTYTPRRLVVINDGEPIRSTRTDVSVVNLDSKISIGAKRQLGLKLAGSSWAATWDDDDFCMPDHLGSMMASAAISGAKYIRSASYALSNQDFRVGCIIPQAVLASAVLHAPTARKVGGYADISYAEDWSLQSKFSLAGFSLTTCPALTYVHRRHVKNITDKHEDVPWGLNAQLRDTLEDQQRWPDPAITDFQNRLDYVRSLQRSCLIRPA